MTKISGFFGNYRWLSNFWPCKIYYEGMWYPSSEHAFQAAKSLDMTERLNMSFLKTAGEVKRYGKTMKLRPDWEEVKRDVMTDIVTDKFTQAHNSDLREKLLNTGDAELVEDNTWGDTYWGVCDGVGFNNLGKILMAVRDVLREDVE
jgi:N-glycosidase YbiA